MGGDVIILGFKTLREQLSIDIMEGLQAKALLYSELTESEHSLAAVPVAGSTVARRSAESVSVSRGDADRLPTPRNAPM